GADQTVFGAHRLGESESPLLAPPSPRGGILLQQTGPTEKTSAKQLATWRQRARALKQETLALCFALRDPRVPWYARLLAAGVVAYALSPIDLIPDFIPVLGYLDDLILVPVGIALVLKLIP